MKIAVFSDSHDNIPNLELFFRWCNKNNIDAVLCCGDVCLAETVEKGIAPFWDKDIHFVFGNAAQKELLLAVTDKYQYMTHHERQGILELGGKQIAFVHYPKHAKRLAATGTYEYVFYGHTHKPWEEDVGDCQVVNPGTLAGLFYKPTFASLNTKTDELQLHLVELLA